jgi:IS30 family transposase
MDGTDARSAREGFTKKLRHVPAPLRKTLTYDRKKEMAEHERLAHRLAIRIFFADPYGPVAAWHQREHQRIAAPVPA